MKLKIWNSDPSEEYEPNQLFVKLIKNNTSDDILLIVVDKEGKEIKCGHLLSLDLDLKCLVLHENLSDVVPLKTDVYGSLLFITPNEFEEIRKKCVERQFVANMIEGIQKKGQETSSKH